MYFNWTEPFRKDYHSEEFHFLTRVHVYVWGWGVWSPGVSDVVQVQLFIWADVRHTDVGPPGRPPSLCPSGWYRAGS